MTGPACKKISLLASMSGVAESFGAPFSRSRQIKRDSCRKLGSARQLPLCPHARSPDMVDFLDEYVEEYGPPPPEGYSTNVRGIVYIVILILSLVIATSFGGIRVYTKAFITHALGWDDCKPHGEIMENYVAWLTGTS